MTARIGKDVMAWVLSCDPRFVRHTRDGVLLSNEDGSETEMTTEAYLDEHDIGTDEVFYATLDLFLSDVKGTTITSTERVVDALLDLRRVFQQYKEEQERAKKQLLHMALAIGGKK